MPRQAAATQLGTGGDAHRGPRLGSSSGSAIGDLSRLAPNSTCAAGCRAWSTSGGAHVPPVCGAKLAGGLQVFGDQRGVLVGGFRLAASIAAARRRCTRHDRISAELRMRRRESTGDGSIFGCRCEPHLVDQLRHRPVRRGPRRSTGRLAARVEPQSDHRRGVQRSLGRRLEPVDACPDSGLDGGRHGRPRRLALQHVIRHARPSSTPRWANSRIISSAKNGFPAARVATGVVSPASEGSAPSNSADKAGT